MASSDLTQLDSSWPFIASSHVIGSWRYDYSVFLFPCSFSWCAQPLQYTMRYRCLCVWRLMKIFRTSRIKPAAWESLSPWDCILLRLSSLNPQTKQRGHHRLRVWYHLRLCCLWNGHSSFTQPLVWRQRSDLRGLQLQWKRMSLKLKIIRMHSQEVSQPITDICKATTLTIMSNQNKVCVYNRICRI